MKKKEIVVLDCGVEVRQEDPGIVFSAYDPGREFAFCLKPTEIVDMISYLDSYLRNMAMKSPQPTVEQEREKRQLVLPSVDAKATVSEKVASIGGITGELLADPRSVKPGAGRAIKTGVSIHQG